MMFFLKDIKRFLFFSSHQPMQRYAGNGRDTRPKWHLKWPPGKIRLLRATFLSLFYNT